MNKFDWDAYQLGYADGQADKQTGWYAVETAELEAWAKDPDYWDGYLDGWHDFQMTAVQLKRLSIAWGDLKASCMGDLLCAAGFVLFVLLILEVTTHFITHR